eukprot:m.135991 g.135991  ORF g.135991 m.135991 type:complete len:303 (+) comp29829_c0_seq5:187-1095(+)
MHSHANMILMVAVTIFMWIPPAQTSSPFLNIDGKLTLSDWRLPDSKRFSIATLNRLRRSMYVCDSDGWDGAKPFPGFIYSITNMANNKVEGYGIGTMHVPPILLEIPMEKKCDETGAASQCTLTMAGPMGEIINASTILFNEVDLLNTTFLASVGECASDAGVVPSVEDQSWNLNLVSPTKDIIRGLLAKLNDDGNDTNTDSDTETATNTSAFETYVQQLTSDIQVGGMAAVEQMLNQLMVTNAVLQQYGRQGLGSRCDNSFACVFCSRDKNSTTAVCVFVFTVLVWIYYSFLLDCLFVVFR